MLPVSTTETSLSHQPSNSSLLVDTSVSIESSKPRTHTVAAVVVVDRPKEEEEEETSEIDGQVLGAHQPPPHRGRAEHHPAVPAVRVGVRHGEPVQGGRRAVAVLLDHLLLHHAPGDARRPAPLLDTRVVPGQGAHRRLARAAAVQGRLLHLRKARQGAARQVPRQVPLAQRQGQGQGQGRWRRRRRGRRRR